MALADRVTLRPAEPEHDFERLAALFTSLEDEPATEAGLREFYEREKDRVIQAVAEEETGDLPGFYWAEKDRSAPEQVYFYLYVRPGRRGQGIGRRLYAEMMQALEAGRAQRLRVTIRDDCAEGLAFAERRGFAERGHSIGMALNLDTFDDRPYDEILARLEGEGFRFTSMEELGDTEEAQRKLYALNDATDRDTPGTDGEPSWDSFEDFQESVCRSKWYKPGGQMVAIDLANGTWAAMSAITVLPGCDYAYNLHTGVDRSYRGRKLAQAVKVRALRYARDVLKAKSVRTHHRVQNLPIIAIDQKLGYLQVPGLFSMQKNVEWWEESMDERTRGKIRGVAVGAAVGDALGMPLEFRLRGPGAPTVREMQGGRLPSGTFTDDTEMALALAESLLAHLPLDPEDVGTRFLGWYRMGPTDVGVHSRAVLEQMDLGEGWEAASKEAQRLNPDSAGNGSVMRCWPLALVYRNDLEGLLADSRLQSLVTHAHPECEAACAFVNAVIYRLLHGSEPKQAVAEALETLGDGLPGGLREAIEAAPSRSREDLPNSGWVRHTVESAVWGLLTTGSFEEAIVQVVNLGDDTDTAGAVTGALAGAAYGLEAIPARWREALRGEWPPRGKMWREADLVDLADRLAERSRAGE